MTVKTVFAILMILQLSVFAQNEMRVVGKGEFQPSELIDRSILDANREVCAGLMIVTDLTGLRYTSYNGIVKVNQNPGKDFLFVSPDERVVEVYCTGYAALKIILSEYGVVLRSGEVWKLKVTGDKISELLPVTIMVTPSNARVYIDNELKDVTSTFQLKEGRHKIKIEKEGHYQMVDEFNVNASNVLFNYKLKEYDLQIVQINSSPIKARIFINKVEKGQTNKGIFLYPGKYNLKLTRQGFLDIDTTIFIAQEQQNTFYFSMQNDKNFGEINITVNEENSQIFINNEEHFDLQRINLTPDIYRISVLKDGFYDISDVVEVKAGDFIEKKFELKPKMGSIAVEISPPDAFITLRQGEKTIRSWQGMSIQKELVIGEYQLVSSKMGFQTMIKKIFIQTDKQILEFIKLNSGTDSLDYSKYSIPDDMVFIQGGRINAEYLDKTTNEILIKEEDIKSFCIGKYEVTQKEWMDIMGNNPSYYKGDSLPVERVSWNDVQIFIQKLNSKTGRSYRLPFESEWQYVAQGCNSTNDNNYSGSNDINEVAWYLNNSEGKTHKVGILKPNEMGIFDMTGNVWEWCDDIFEIANKNKTSKNGKNNLRIIRGGAFNSQEKLSKIDFRNAQTQDFFDFSIGFRLILNLE